MITLKVESRSNWLRCRWRSACLRLPSAIAPIECPVCTPSGWRRAFVVNWDPTSKWSREGTENSKCWSTARPSLTPGRSRHLVCSHPAEEWSISLPKFDFQDLRDAFPEEFENPVPYRMARARWGSGTVRAHRPTVNLDRDGDVSYCVYSHLWPLTRTRPAPN